MIKRQTGATDYVRDRKRSARRPGYRVSKSGKKYYEARKNRSDKNPRRGL